MFQLETIKVKHAGIKALDYVFINATDFDPDVHTIYLEPGEELPPVPSDEPPVVEYSPEAEVTADEPTIALETSTDKTAEPAPAETAEKEKIQEEAAEDQETEPAPTTTRKRRNTPTA